MQTVAAILLLVVMIASSAGANFPQSNAADIMSAIEATDKALRSSDPIEVDSIRADMAAALACLQRFEDAERTAAGIESDEYRRLAYVAIALACAQDGDVARAIRVAGGSPGRDGVLTHVACWQIGEGRFEAAFETVLHIDDDAARGFAMLAIAEGRAEAGDRSRAQEMIGWAAGVLQSSLEDNDVLAALAAAHAAAGNIDEAGRLVRQLEQAEDHESDLARFLVKIVAGHATAGNMDAAVALAARIPTGRGREEAFRRAGVLRLQNGDEAGAVRMALRAPVGEFLWREELLLAIVKRRVAAGQLAAAEDLSREIDLPGYRAEALLRIAHAWHQAGEATVARGTLKKAGWSVQRCRDESTRAGMLAELARWQALCDDRDGARDSLKSAIELAKSIDESQLPSRSYRGHLRTIVMVQLQIGDTAGARSTLRYARGKVAEWNAAGRMFGESVLDSLTEMAGHLVEAGDLQAATDLARSASSEGFRSAVYAAIAEALSRRKGLAAAGKWVEDTVPETVQAKALMAAVRAEMAAKKLDCGRTVGDLDYNGDCTVD